ncbi:Type II secretion system protein [Sulfitobacter noctilucae]|nr:Type II secretion system protein [Sulfitobacter noctilucae]
MTIMIWGLGLALNIGLILFGLILADRQRRYHMARLQRAQGRTTAAAEKPGKVQKRVSYAELSFMGRVLARLDDQLAQTSLTLGARALLVQAGLGVLTIFAGGVLGLGMHPVTALVLALLLPWGIVTMILKSAQARYRLTFTEGLPEALDIFARGLRAGRPVSDSLSIVVKSSKGPLAHEFTRCHDAICMGTALPDSLDRLAQRVPTPEVCFFSVATALQAETGGNLIETMENLAMQLRERRKLRKKARALSSEARASAAILASLPFAVCLLIAFLNLGYLEPLYADARGQVMSLVAVTSVSMGVFIMARMGKLDV